MSTAVAHDAAWLRQAPLRAARPALRSLAVTWAYFWGIFAVVAVALPIVLQRFGELEGSVVGFLGAGPRWFGFSMLIILVAAGFGPNVALGLTRSAFFRTVLVVVAATALLTTALWVAAHAIEHAAFTAAGWPTGMIERHSYDDSSQLGLVALEMLPGMLVYTASGAATAAAYYRAGGLWGTLALPLTVGPALLSDAVMSSGWQGRLMGEEFLAPVGVRVLVPLVLAVGLLVLANRVLSRAAVRRVSTTT